MGGRGCRGAWRGRALGEGAGRRGARGTRRARHSRGRPWRKAQRTGSVGHSSPQCARLGQKKARAREAPDCPGSPTSDQKRALGGSRNLQGSRTVRMDDFQLLQDFCASLLRLSWQASADLHVSWNTETTGQYDSTGYGDIGWRPNS